MVPNTTVSLLILIAACVTVSATSCDPHGFESMVEHTYPALATDTVCSGDTALSSGVIYVQLETPPVLPYLYNSLCFFPWWNGPSGSTVAVAATVVSYTPSQIAADTRTWASSDFISDQDILVGSYHDGPVAITLPFDLTIYKPFVYIGVMMKLYASNKCDTLGVWGTYNPNTTRKMAWSRFDFESDDDLQPSSAWLGGFGWSVQSLGMSASGVPLSTVPTGWSCDTTKLTDGKCDCNCGAPDPACSARGDVSNSCLPTTTARCSVGACVTPGWSSSIARCSNKTKFGGDGVCDCECGGVRDPDCDDPAAVFPEGVCDGMVAPKCNSKNKCEDQWTCNATWYNDGTTCNCGCGVHDPDCTTANSASAVECSSQQTCQQGRCVPSAWVTHHCNPENYDDGATCDCDCGAYDPDCDLTTAPTWWCGKLTLTSCSYSGVCIEASCKNNHTESLRGEECDLGLYCQPTCKCVDGYVPTSPLSRDCKVYCGNGMRSDPEECDQTPGCNNETCMCDVGLTFDSTLLSCQGCGNLVVESGEYCDGGEGCFNCSCLAGYTPTSPPTIQCLKLSAADGSKAVGLAVGLSVGGVVAVIVVCAAVAIFIIVFVKIRSSQMAMDNNMVSLNPMSPATYSADSIAISPDALASVNFMSTIPVNMCMLTNINESLGPAALTSGFSVSDGCLAGGSGMVPPPVAPVGGLGMMITGDDGQLVMVPPPPEPAATSTVLPAYEPPSSISVTVNPSLASTATQPSTAPSSMH